jgi:hypothetical protein
MPFSDSPRCRSPSSRRLRNCAADLLREVGDELASGQFQGSVRLQNVGLQHLGSARIVERVLEDAAGGRFGQLGARLPILRDTAGNGLDLGIARRRYTEAPCNEIPPRSVRQYRNTLGGDHGIAISDVRGPW